MKRVAVIDTGTNSTRLLVADASAHGVEELERFTAITRLGEGVDDTGFLAGQAKERVRECINGYAEKIAELMPEVTVVLATSSVRDAHDGEEFLAEVSRAHDFQYRLLSGEEEANLSFAGAAMDLAGRGRTMLFDVGGGSTEVVVGEDSTAVFARSLRLGCVRVSERFFTAAPVPESELDAATSYIDNMLKSEIDANDLAGIGSAVAVAGTVTSLAAIDLGLETYDRDRVHGHVIKTEAVARYLGSFAAQAVDSLMRIPTMEKGRADVITAGTLIVSRLLSYAGLREFTVSERDILDGAAMAIARDEL